MYFHILPLLVILLIPPVFADNDSIQISSSSNDSITPFIATDSTNIYVMWADHSRSGSSEIFFSKSIDGGETFSTPKNISNKQGASLAPFFVTNGTNIYVTWTYRYPDNYSEGWSDDNSEIFFSKSTDGGLTFSSPQKISSDSSFAHLSKLAIDGENIFLMWDTITRGATLPENIEIHFSKSTDGGKTFNTPQNLSNNEGFSDSQSIAVDGSNVFIAWSDEYMDNTAIFLIKSTDGGQTFSTLKNISDNMRYSDAPSIAVDGSDIFIAWMYQVKGENYDILFSKSTDGGLTFSTLNISNTSGFSTVPTIAINGSNIFVTWVDGQTTSSPILFSKSTDGGLTFSPPQTISSDTGFSSSQSITTDGKNIFNVWSWAERSPEDQKVLIFSKSPIVPSLTENSSEVMLDDTNSALPQQDKSVSEKSDISNSTDTPSVKNIQWLEEDYSDYAVGGIGIIRLDNSALNVNKTLIDIPAVRVWSDTDPKGIPVDMIETGADTGVFYADISLSSVESSYLQLHVSSGDTITVSYEDESLDEPLADALEIILKYSSPLKQFKAGVRIDKIQCSESLQIILKTDGNPACVKPESIEKLRERGWTNSKIISDELVREKILELTRHLENGQVAEFNELRTEIVAFVLLEQVDAAGINLDGINLENISLPGADLQNVTLKDANIRNADLSNANLQGSNLEGADLSHTKLWGVNLHGANLQNANLRETSLRSTDLSNANLQNSDLEGSDLPITANISNADLRNVKNLPISIDEARERGALVD